MKELVEVIAKALVDHPEDVDVKSVDGQQVTVLEAQDFLGGLATTLRGTTGAGFDFGPHAYHARNQRVLNMFKEIAHDGFPARAKNVRIKFRGKYYKYPLEALDIARSMSPFLAARALGDYALESIRKKLRPRALVSAEDWVVQAMGRTLYSLFFGPYTTKVWGVPPSELASSFAQHRIPHISLAKVIVSSLRKGRSKITGTEHRYAATSRLASACGRPLFSPSLRPNASPMPMPSRSPHEIA